MSGFMIIQVDVLKFFMETVITLPSEVRMKPQINLNN